MKRQGKKTVGNGKFVCELAQSAVFLLSSVILWQFTIEIQFSIVPHTSVQRSPRFFMLFPWIRPRNWKIQYQIPFHHQNSLDRLI